MGMYFVKNWYCKPLKDDAIYGAERAGGSDPSWVRTDAAVGFANPNPYYAGMSTTPSSPFDNIMPWSGMRRVTDASAGELVEIPKFYYKWTRDGVKMKLQISMSSFDGSHVSPAHADRGDGVGERDYVYVGRYSCCSSNYKSVSGLKPKVSTTISSFRQNITSLGSNIWQNDFAMYWTIRMLYLVEFANWDSQAVIGYGCSTGGSLMNMGYTDSMPYHTGTERTSRIYYGGTQYRYIEGLWDNAWEYCDGIYNNSTAAYVITNPSSFSSSDTGGAGTNIGIILSSTDGSTISAYMMPNISGYEWALVPSRVTGGYWDLGISRSSTCPLIMMGGDYNQNRNNGLFAWYANDARSKTYANATSRLMVLPPSRLAA